MQAGRAKADYAIRHGGSMPTMMELTYYVLPRFLDADAGPGVLPYRDPVGWLARLQRRRTRHVRRATDRGKTGKSAHRDHPDAGVMAGSVRFQRLWTDGLAAKASYRYPD